MPPNKRVNLTRPTVHVVTWSRSPRRLRAVRWAELGVGRLTAVGDRSCGAEGGVVRRFEAIAAVIGACLLLAGCSHVASSSSGIDATAPGSPTPVASASATTLSALSATGVLPRPSSRTLELTGVVVGSEGRSYSTNGPVRLAVVTLAVHISVDGINAKLELPLTVNGRSKVFDASGAEVPRLKRADTVVHGLVPWIATVRRQGDEPSCCSR